MKKTIVSLTMFATVFGTASVATPTVAHAQVSGETIEELQMKLIGLLEQLVRTYQNLFNTSDGDMMEDDMMKGKYTLTLDTNLETLSEGYYEGWIIVGDDKISTGLFQEGGEQVFHFDTPINTIDKVAITIEPEVDPDPGPSGIIALVGEVEDGDVDLSFPIDFTDAAGSAILATPTDGENNNETSGVWFLSVPGPEASLELPELPEGWVYEGWAVHNGMPLTTGRFTSVDEADDFDGYSGPQSGPNYPGEDFIVNAPAGIEFPIDLADGESKIVISVEPDIDGVDPTGTGPAQVKPLLTEVEAGQADHANITLEQHLESLPSGTATLR